MARQQRGSIVLLSSQVAAQGSPGQAAYAASKAALEGMARSLAKELAASGIRINTVAPGFIETDLVAHYDDGQRQQLAAQTALGRLGKADDVAALAAFLLGDGAAYITGQTLAVDGGLTL
jgi:3-oxoacyl-[acyl-carrier protein] reductase